MTPRPRAFGLLALVSALALVAAPLRAQDSAAVRAYAGRTKVLADSIAKRSTSKIVDAQAAHVKALADSLVAAARIVPPAPPVPPTPDTTPTPPPVVTPPTVPPVVPPVIASSIAAHPYLPPSNGAVLAELPRDSVSIAFPTILRAIPVVNLQQALDTARTGDALELAKCSTHPPITLKLTPRADWVVVRTAGVEDGQVTTKMTPARADSLCLATIQTNDATSPVWVNPGAHHVRFTMVRLVANFGPLNAIFRASNTEATPAELPHHITLDRVVIDGRSFDVRRCSLNDVRYFAIVYSTLENCHSKNGDAQATVSGNSPGPFRIQGNTLHGSHQGTMFGGYDSRSAAMMPADAYVADNLIERPPEWTAQGWGEKTLVEQKAGLRMLYERNIVRHVHKNGQAGFAFLTKTENQNCAAPWTQSADVTIRYNVIEDVANGFNFAANVGACAGVNAARLAAYGNLVGPFNGTDVGAAAQILGPTDDVIILHNTFASAGMSAVVFDANAVATRGVIAGNVIPHGQYGVKGASTTEGSATVTKFMPFGLFRDNAVVPAQCSLYPVSTICSVQTPWPLAWDGQAIGADTTKVAR